MLGPAWVGSMPWRAGALLNGPWGTPVFKITDLNPEWWVRADDVNYQEPARTNISGDTDPVGSYSDITANAHHFEQSTSSAKPTTEANQFNGLPSVDFDGGDEVRTANYSPATTGITVAMAINPTDVAGNKGIFEFKVDDTYKIICFIASSTVKVIATINSVIRLNQVFGAIATGIQTLIVTIGEDKRTVKIYLDNVLLDTKTAGADLTLVGASDVGHGKVDTVFFTGDITESFKFNTVATVVQRAQIQSYLSRWL